LGIEFEHLGEKADSGDKRRSTNYKDSTTSSGARMITTIRSAEVRAGKADRAFKWAVEVTQYVNREVPDLEVQVYRNVGGPLFEVHWISHFPSLAAYQASRDRLESHVGFIEKVSEAAESGLFLGTSFRDRLYETLCV